jgi:8-amino-7-oxononanoate synthase
MKIAPQLAALNDRGLRRRRRVADTPCGPQMTIDGKPVLAFASNDYLGLAADPHLVEAAIAGARRWGVGAGASHLLGGHCRDDEALERRLATFVGAGRALLFTNGYMANLGVVTALAGRGDAVFADRLNHASLIDAVRLSQADSHRYPHGDLAALGRALARSSATNKLVVTDAVFSMDGDIADLTGIMALAEQFDARVVVDDAHGFGVLGPHGQGSAAHCGLPVSGRLIMMGTLGKAAGVAGAFVAGDDETIEWLLQTARTSIFTTAAPPMLASALLESIALIEAGDDRRRHLRRLIDRLRSGLEPLCARTGWRLPRSATAIQPLIIGGNHEVVATSEALTQRGIWVPAIRPPTVPQGAARLRISLSAAHTEAQVDQLIAALADVAT